MKMNDRSSKKKERGNTKEIQLLYYLISSNIFMVGIMI